MSTGGNLVPVIYNRFVVGTALASATKKRQKRTTFSPEIIKRLKEEFAENNAPNAYRMNELGTELGLDYKAVRIWFCNRRQELKAKKS